MTKVINIADNDAANINLSSNSPDWAIFDNLWYNCGISKLMTLTWVRDGKCVAYSFMIAS